MAKPAYLSKTAYATPKSISDDRRDGREPDATIHVVFPHGKGSRAITVHLDEADLLVMISNAADALRLLNEWPPR
jgi:hypothetical protein